MGLPFFPYTGGTLVFKSKFAAFRVHVRPELIKYHPVTGVEIGKQKALVAEFGTLGEEYTAEDPMTGRTEKWADISGHYWDSKIAQEQNSWTDEERETAETVVNNWCSRWPEAVQLWSAPKAEKPWPKYDETHHNQIPTLAETLGLVAESLAYEQENKNRESVITKLSELLSVAPSEDSLTVA